MQAVTDSRYDTPKRPPPAEEEEEEDGAEPQGSEWGRKYVKKLQRMVKKMEGESTSASTRWRTCWTGRETRRGGSQRLELRHSNEPTTHKTRVDEDPCSMGIAERSALF